MLTAFIIIFSLLSVFYIFLILSYLKAWLQTPEEFVDTNFSDVLAVTILVPARNEAFYIENCLQSLLNQNYDSKLVEIIFIDDFSDDDTFLIAAKQKGVNCYQLANLLAAEFKNTPNKKRALNLGIAEAKNDVIITVDADSFYPENWLKALTQFYTKRKPKLISAPVAFFKGKGLFDSFLAMDLFSLMGVTAASIKKGKPTMVNGANLLFAKTTFDELNGYQGNENVASGDDIFLMQKIDKAYPGQIAFLKNYDAITETQAPKDFKTFVNQRIRWTSKSSRHADAHVVLTLSLNYFYYLSLAIAIFLSFFYTEIRYITILSLSLKLIVDLVFFNNVLIFFKRKNLLKKIFFIEILHLFYINILGLLSLVGKYTWKGRKV